MPTFTSLGSQYLVSTTPWPYESERNREWYWPYMAMPYMRESLWYRIVSYAINMEQVHATQVVLSERIPPGPDISEQEFRGITLPRHYFDSMSFTVDFKSYGGAVQMHKYDQMIWQWAETVQKNPTMINEGIPSTAMAQVIQNDLSQSMVQTLDVLARNAFLVNAKNRSFASDATGFHDLAAGDTFNPEIARAVKLGAGYSPYGAGGTFPAILSPAATYSTKLLSATDNTYMRWKEATADSRLLNYEIGQFEDINWVENWRMVLWNCGEVLASASITVALEPGDGAPDPATVAVDDHWNVGAADATHYVQLSNITDPTTAETGFKLHDIVTLVRTRPAANGPMATQNGVVWNDYRNIDAEIVTIDYSTNRIGLRLPVLNEYYSTAISTGLYGWVIKARPVHAAIFLKRGLRDVGVGAAVMQPPKFYITPPADVRKAVWTFSWDAYMKYQMMDPDSFQVHFYTGPVYRNGTVLSL